MTEPFLNPASPTAARPRTESLWRPWRPALTAFAGFGVWLSWSVMTVQMLNAGLGFSVSQLFSLIAIAGMAGATLRITMGFTALATGGQLLLYLALALLLIPALAVGWILPLTPPLWLWQFLALLTGLGGGLFTVCLAQVGRFAARRDQDVATGLVIGVGQLGVTSVQVLLPLGMTVALWQGLGGEPVILTTATATLLGSVPAGAAIWMQNASFMLLLMLALMATALLYLPKMPAPDFTRAQTVLASSRAVVLGLVAAALGAWLVLPAESNGIGLQFSKELVLLLVAMGSLMLLRPGEKHGVARLSDTVFNNKHAWILGLLGTMSLGSLLGFAAAFPLLIQSVFGYHNDLAGTVHQAVNNSAPGALTYAWMGPLAGILARPLGGLAAERLGGARVTQACALVMAVCSAGAAHYVALAHRAPQPELYFLPFLLLFLVLFAAAGAGHAAVHQTVQRVFSRAQANRINVWLAAAGAYGVFYIPQVLGEQIAQQSPARALIHFAAFYAICMLANGWFYLRKSSVFYRR